MSKSKQEAAMKKSVELLVHRWTLSGHTREYVELTLPFKEARTLFVAKKFNAFTGEGEQRENFEAHVKSLRKEMTTGEYTPAGFSAALNVEQRKKIKWVEDNDTTTAKFTLEGDDPISLIDGDHRFSALKTLLKDYETNKKTEAVKEIEALPISLLIYLNGDPKKDFVNLQKGRTVDAAHLFSLKKHRRLLPQRQQPFADLAFDVARKLHANKESPLYKRIRFDTRSQNVAGLISISTLCAKGSSDIGTSLLGLAKVGTAFQKKADWLAKIVEDTYRELVDEESLALDPGYLLQLPPGPKGAATLFIGVATLMVYRCCVQEAEEFNEDDIKALTTAVEDNLAVEIGGNFSGPLKRQKLGEVARAILADIDIDKHDGIPVPLVKLLSASTLDVEPLPKEKKVKAEA